MTQLNRTNCEEAFRKLNDYLDHRLTPEEMRIIEEHLRICAWCTREFAFEASVLDGIKRKLRQIEAPPDFVSKILSHLQRSEGLS